MSFLPPVTALEAHFEPLPTTTHSGVDLARIYRVTHAYLRSHPDFIPAPAGYDVVHNQVFEREALPSTNTFEGRLEAETAAGFEFRMLKRMGEVGEEGYKPDGNTVRKLRESAEFVEGRHGDGSNLGDSGKSPVPETVCAGESSDQASFEGVDTAPLCEHANGTVVDRSAPAPKDLSPESLTHLYPLTAVTPAESFLLRRTQSPANQAAATQMRLDEPAVQSRIKAFRVSEKQRYKVLFEQENQQQQRPHDGKKSREEAEKMKVRHEKAKKALDAAAEVYEHCLQEYLELSANMSAEDFDDNVGGGSLGKGH